MRCIAIQGISVEFPSAPPDFEPDSILIERVRTAIKVFEEHQYITSDTRFFPGLGTLYAFKVPFYGTMRHQFYFKGDCCKIEGKATINDCDGWKVIAFHLED